MARNALLESMNYSPTKDMYVVVDMMPFSFRHHLILLHRVVAFSAEGMTAEQTAQGQPQATTEAMPLEGGDGIVGAGWGETAGPGEQGREKKLVEPNKMYADRLHDTILSVDAIGRLKNHSLQPAGKYKMPDGKKRE